MAKLLFLGTGTSTGVPQLGCKCEVCQSTDPRDNRLRCSALYTSESTRLLFDCSPDFRMQALRAHIDHIDALLVTHAHYDHTGGIDDLRPYCTYDPMPLYAEEFVLDQLRNRLPYCFAENPYPGVPRFDTRNLAPYEPFTIGGVEVKPVRVMHYQLPIVGFRIGKMAYITDCLTMPQETKEQLQGVEVLVINALRHTEHISHQTLNDALKIVRELSPRCTYLIHMSHDMGLHAEVAKQLPENVYFAYDGLEIDV